jgi:hypothetical protein
MSLGASQSLPNYAQSLQSLQSLSSLSSLSQAPTGVTVVTPAPRSSMPVVVAAALVALAAVGGGLAWRAWTVTAETRSAAAALHLGDVGVLHSLEGLPTVMLFDNRDDFDAVTRATNAKDEAAYKQLVRSRATFVPVGTKAREVEAVLQGSVRVQLVDGPRPGFTGWTFSSCLQPK